MLLKCKGWDKVVAITDSMQAAGLPDGDYMLGINPVTVTDGDAKISGTDIRAGSTLTLAQAVRKISAFTGEGPEKVLPLLTANPARLIGEFHRRGDIAVGKGRGLCSPFAGAGYTRHMLGRQICVCRRQRIKEDKIMLVPLRPLMEAAEKYNYAQGAFNVNAVAQAKAVIEMHETFRSPAILQGADLANAFMGGRVDFANGTLEDKKVGARRIADAVRKYGEGSPIPVVLHLDHGKDFDSCVAAIDGGYTSVMIDGSSLPWSRT